MHPALFYRPGDRLSLPELGAARLDGHVVEVGDGYMPADSVEGRDARATGIAHLVPRHAVACGPTAAWVHGAGDRPPAVHHVRRLGARRGRIAPSPGVVHHDVTTDPSDVQILGGVAVTAPLPTARELAFGAARRPEDEHWLRALIDVSPGLVERLHEHLAVLPRMPGRRRALLLVERLRS